MELVLDLLVRCLVSLFEPLVWALKECLAAHETIKLFSDPIFVLASPVEIVVGGQCRVAKEVFLLVEVQHGSLDLHSSCLCWWFGKAHEQPSNLPMLASWWPWPVVFTLSIDLSIRVSSCDLSSFAHLILFVSSQQPPFLLSLSSVQFLVTHAFSLSPVQPITFVEWCHFLFSLWPPFCKDQVHSRLFSQGSTVILHFLEHPKCHLHAFIEDYYQASWQHLV